MKISKFFTSVAVSTLVGCGGQVLVEPPSEETGVDIANLDDQSIPIYGTFEEAIVAGAVPPGSDGFCRPTVGQYCFIPASTTIVQKNFNTTQTDPVWFDSINVERDLVNTRLNSLGWNVTQGDAGNPSFWYTEIGTIHPTIPGRVGEAMFWAAAYIQAPEGGFYVVHNICRATIYKQTITSRFEWNFLTADYGTAYVRNIIDHEMMHCAGLPHTTIVNSLMYVNGVGTRKTFLDPTPAEITILDNYNP